MSSALSPQQQKALEELSGFCVRKMPPCSADEKLHLLVIDKSVAHLPECLYKDLSFVLKGDTTSKMS